MVNIFATSTSLRIGDHEILLESGVEFRVGSYGKSKGPFFEFYWEYAKELARKKGIIFNENGVSCNGSEFFLGKMFQMINLMMKNVREFQ